MPRYNGNKQEPRSKRRRYWMRRRQVLDRSEKSMHRTPTYKGPGHGKDGPLSPLPSPPQRRFR